MASTYTPIATTTLGSSTASYTFSSIPSTYTHLILVTSGLVTTSEYLRCRINSDTGSNYSSTVVEGNGASISSYRYSNLTNLPLQISHTLSTTIPNVVTSYFINYANTTTNKNVMNVCGRGGGRAEQNVGYWRSTSAISSITVLVETGSLAAGTVMTLYGITAA